MLQTKVKASSLTHLTDARYFAAWETEWLGVRLSDTPGEGIEPAQLLAIREWVDGVQICGELPVTDAATILAQAEFLQLDWVELRAETDPDTLATVAAKLPIILEVPVEGYTAASDITELLRQNHTHVEYFLLNLAQGGITWSDLQEGHPFGAAQIQRWAQTYPLLLEVDTGSLAPSTLIEQTGVAGFSVRGGEEEKVGYKSFDELDAFFEDIELQL
jgi:phosphoribosylanthranilate isomerase